MTIVEQWKNKRRLSFRVYSAKKRQRDAEQYYAYIKPIRPDNRKRQPITQSIRNIGAIPVLSAQLESNLVVTRLESAQK